MSYEQQQRRTLRATGLPVSRSSAAYTTAVAPSARRDTTAHYRSVFRGGVQAGARPEQGLTLGPGQRLHGD